jgi:hypothetical protein
MSNEELIMEFIGQMRAFGKDKILRPYHFDLHVEIMGNNLYKECEWLYRAMYDDTLIDEFILKIMKYWLDGEECWSSIDVYEGIK